jgi:DNA-binding Lrp family transcriptional regulator
MEPDDLDRQLISLLQANARESTANLARRLGPKPKCPPV